jgi:hypothetical protein
VKSVHIVTREQQQQQQQQQQQVLLLSIRTFSLLRRVVILGVGSSVRGATGLRCTHTGARVFSFSAAAVLRHALAAAAPVLAFGVCN